MSAQLSELQFYNQETGGSATSARQGKIQYINSVMGTSYKALEVAEKAYYEYLKANPPIPPLEDTEVIVSDGDTLAEAGGGTIAVSVTAGVATYTYTAP
jgi:hypothetical protein